MQMIEERDVRKEGWGFEPGDVIVPGVVAQKLLGGGRRYEAYLATHDLLATAVVVKILRPHRVGDAASLRGLVAEKVALDAMQHPMILRSFGAALDDRRPHLILEHVEGPRLSSLIRRYGPLPLEQALPLAIQVASALHYMHATGWTHLDVKPKNIIMSGPPRLIDLSIARTIQMAAATRDPIGTDAYMAPEQAAPEESGGMGPPADVWGLGVTMFEALTGELPFPRGNDEHPHPQLHLSPAPMPVDRVPPDLRRIVELSLQRDPGARPSASEVLEMSERMIELLPTKPALGRLRPRFRDR